MAWSTDAQGGQALAEFAGRACYGSWSKPNPATATNATYLAHILEVGHLAVFEHGSATVYLTGVSRSVTHELVRHRHLSFSELSQRHAPDGVVEPDVIAADPLLHGQFTAAVRAGQDAYQGLLGALETTTDRRQARQAARSVLPNATRTRAVISGNYRAWRHFIAARGSEHADIEIRAVAVAVLRELRTVAPNVFADFTVTALRDGSEIAASPFALQS